MNKILIRPLEPEEYSEWDHFVNTNSQGTIFHSSIWVNTLADLFNQRGTIFGCFLNERIIGGFVLYRPRSWRIFAQAHSTAAMSSFGGLIVKSDPRWDCLTHKHNLDSVIRAVTEDLRALGLRYVFFELSPPFFDVRSFMWNGWKEIPRYTYVVSPQSVLPSKEARRYIRRAEEAGFVVERMTDSETYFQLFSDTYTRQGLPPPLTREQMRRLWRVIDEAGLGRMWVARTPAGEWAAAAIQLNDQKRTYAWSATSNVELRKSGANYLLQNTIFQHEASDGFVESYLFTANMPNLANFQKQFGPCLSLYHQVSIYFGRLNCFSNLP
ncbi:Acetyltransferase (GNAT) domain protein [anaerobic digester metagenome]